MKKIRKAPRGSELFEEQTKAFATAYDILLGSNPKSKGRTTDRQPREFWAIRRLVVEILWLMDESETEGIKPPTFSEVRRLLADTEDMCRALSPNVLRLSDSLTLNDYAVMPNRLLNGELWRLLARSGLRGAHSDPARNDSPLYGRLVALEGFCRGFKEFVPDGPSGRTSFLSGRVGSRKARMVINCGRIFLEFRPDALSMSETGPFYGFCTQIYDLLTGKSGEGEKVGLKRYVEFVVTRLKEREALSISKRALEEFRTDTPPDADLNHEIYRLGRNILAIDDELETGYPVREKDI